MGSFASPSQTNGLSALVRFEGNRLMSAKDDDEEAGFKPQRCSFGKPRHGAQLHPCAARTLSITSRIAFHVCACSSFAFGNMQPSQQMCWMPRAAASFSQ